MGSWTPPDLPAAWRGATHPVLVGREREIALLDEAWSACVRGARQVVLLGGEPGAGKTRLAAEAAVRAAEHGAAVLLGTCVAEFGPAYQPFVEPLQALTGAVRRAELDAPGLDPDLLERLADLTRTRPGPAAGHQEHRREVLDAAVELVRAAGREHPLVLLLDDLQWAADSGLELLVHLLERTADARLLVVGTHRTTPADRSSALVHALATLARLEGTRRLDLPALSEAEVADYVEAELGPGAPGSRRAAAVLHTRSGGNPFFLRELWRDLASRGGGLPALADDLFRAPASVRDLVQARLDALDDVARDLLEVAAVMGQDVDTALLVSAVDAPTQTLLEAHDQVVRAGLLEPAPGGSRFRHALVRQAVLELTPATRVLRRHAQVAQALAAGPHRAPLRVQRMAHHYERAAVLGHGAAAARCLVEAADIASSALAHVDAGQLLLRAAALSTGEQRDRTLVAAARSLLLGGDSVAARRTAEPVAARGGPGTSLQAAITYELASWRPGRPGHRAAELLRLALDRGAADPADPDRVQGLACLGRALAFSGHGEAAAVADAAIAAARATGDPLLLARTLEPSLQHPLRPADVPLRLERARELTALSSASDEVDLLAPAAYYRATIGYLRGDLALLRDAHSDLARAASATGQNFWAWIGGCLSYGLQYVRGELADAEQTCRQLRSLGQAFGEDDVEGPHGLQTFMLRREAGRLEQVRSLVTGSEPAQGHWLPGLLALYAELGLTEPARRVLWTVLDGPLADYQQSAEWPGVLAFLVEGALLLRDAPAAGRLRPLLLEHEGTNLLAGPFVALFGSADRHLAGLDELLGEGDPEQRYAAALALDRRTSAPLHEAHTLAALAAHRRRHPAQGRSHEEPEAQARAIGERLGLVRLLRSLPAAADARGPAADGVLTRREEEVLALVAEGMSNREIARRLVVTENTAANHVRSILQKTGSANRTQAALYARRRLRQ